MPPEADLEMDRQYTAWRNTDHRHAGVMARQGFYRGWREAIQYAKHHPEVLQ